MHILTPDGRVTEFKDRVIVVPDDGADGIYAVLVNRHGEPYVTPDGEPAMVSCPKIVAEDGKQAVVVEIPVIAFDSVIPEADRLIDFKGLRRLLPGHSDSTLERWTRDGTLPKPIKVRAEGRAVVFREGDVREAIRKIVEKR